MLRIRYRGAVLDCADSNKPGEASMGLIDRVKNILIAPKTEWEVIAGETTGTGALITGYVLPLAIVAAVAGFIGSTVVGTSLGFMGTFRMPFAWGLVMALYQVVMAVVGVFLIGFIIDTLAPNFGAQKNFAQAIKVAAYSYTPAWVVGILMILPMLAILGILGALYGLYLLYLGLPRLMKNPEEKSVVYTVVVVICAIVVGIIISVVGGLITAPAMMAAGGGMGGGFMGRAAPEVTYDKDSPMGKLDQFAKQMEAAGKKMEAAEKSGDPGKAMGAAMEVLGVMAGGGARVEPVAIDRLKPLVPESLAGLPMTSSKAETSGIAGLMVSKAEATYGGGARQIKLEITDTGGASGLVGLASWAGVQGEKEDERRIERTRNEGGRMVHEEISKTGGPNKYAVIVANRFVVGASGSGMGLNEVKGAVASVDLGQLEAMKDEGVKK